jgi:hypothetical protein
MLKRFSILLVFLALPIGYFFGEEEYVRHSQIEAISKAPGFAGAVFQDILETASKKHISYRVRFKFEVNGQQYSVLTTPTDRQGALAYLTEKDVQIAYSTRDPSVHMLRRYYDLRNPRDTLFKSLAVTSLLSLMLALPGALLIGWRLGWLKRRKNR